MMRRKTSALYAVC